LVFVLTNGKYYEATKIRGNFKDVFQECEKNGGELARFSTQKDIEDIYKLCKDTGAPGNGCYVGFDDLAVLNDWRWLDGSEFDGWQYVHNDGLETGDWDRCGGVYMPWSSKTPVEDFTCDCCGGLYGICEYDVDYCCSQNVKSKKWAKTCPSLTNQAQCETIRPPGTGGAKCQWSRCDSIGYCTWPGPPKKKAERACAKKGDRNSCEQKSFGNKNPIFCKWNHGYPTDAEMMETDELYYELEDDAIIDMEVDEAMDAEEALLFGDLKGVNEEESTNGVNIYAVLFILLIVMAGIYWYKYEGSKGLKEANILIEAEVDRPLLNETKYGAV